MEAWGPVAWWQPRVQCLAAVGVSGSRWATPEGCGMRRVHDHRCAHTRYNARRSWTPSWSFLGPNRR